MIKEKIMDNKNNVVCDFVGYHLKKCSYIRDIKSRGLKKIEIKLSNLVTIDVNKACRFEIQVSIIFLDDNKSTFVYSSLFKINDFEWYKQQVLNVKQGLTQLFCVVYPYIRQSISSITNDSIGSVILPTVNVIGLDVNKPMVFEYQYKNK